LSDHSVEHSLIFNTARRILKFVAPDFRAIATEELQPSESILDLQKRTVEVPEGDPYVAAGMIIFAASTLRLRNNNPSIFFGDILEIKHLSDDNAVLAAAHAHEIIDQLSWRWAANMMHLYYPDLEYQQALAYSDQRMNLESWILYFEK
jgi:hypothetical protein